MDKKGYEPTLWNIETVSNFKYNIKLLFVPRLLKKPNRSMNFKICYK